MTDTANLKLPFIEGSQAQKHVTHNEALRILDAAIQIAVLDLTRTAAPSSPAEGQRHVVAAAPTGAWAGQAHAIATFQDGAWAFLAPNTGWCIWSVADNVMFVYDGAGWRDLRDLPVSLDNAAHVGINTAASAPNLLSVKSNAALLAAINAADGGSGDLRLQLSKESAARTASLFFSDNYSGRAEFGLVGSDAFKLKVSADGASWVEAFNIDQSTGNLALPRGLALSGVIAPSQITTNQNDYNPAGIATASVLQISSDAARSVSGLAGGAEGRVVVVVNVGGQPITLLDESAASTAANRFTLGGNLTLAGKQAAMLRYDGTAARWQALSGGMAVRADTAQSLTPAQQNQAQKNSGIAAIMRGHLAGLTLSTAGSSATFGIAAGVAADSSNADIMTLSGACAKTTSSWAVGSGNGALDTGSIANNTWYHVHLIKRIDTGVVDVLVSTSASSPTLPANYTLSRRIGSLLTDGSAHWVAFNQNGDEFLWLTGYADINSGAYGTSATLVPLSVPTGVKVNALLSGWASNPSQSWLLISSPDETDSAPSAFSIFSALLAAGGFTILGFLNLRTNSSGQVRIRSDHASTTVNCYTRGYIDRRGRDG